MAGGLIIASTLVSTYAAIKQGQFAAAQAQSQGEDLKAKAEGAKRQGERESREQKKQSRRFLSTVRTRIAGSGIEFSGSPLLAMEETAANLEYDAIMTKYGYKNKASGLLAQAGMYEASAKNFTQAGYLNAAGSLLKGAQTYATYSNG